ncbi:ABC transporter, permease protein 2 (cluster 1, maltose/g3p/polyamine/iron) [hydrothermal vent metagenome]|uniref:ABC transporter, permease protein 2 (Cluster 1, maltose/g3p/polyamine/iron) n=1 Tax=hydrothermal vent metagenome TaxID=652676 RepID=A0A3B0SY75_9ZZZZ
MMNRLRRVLIAVALVVVVFPYAWVVISSIKSQADLSDPTRLVFSPTLVNWKAVVEGGILGSAATSVVVGVVTVVIALVSGTLAAYSISKLRTGGDKTRFTVLLSEMMPPAVLVIPLFFLALSAGVRDTLFAIIPAHLTFVVPVVTWFMIGFFDAVPDELEEQARVDGYGRVRAFWKVVLPQVLPGLGAAAIFAFILSWNDLFYALILAGGNTRTLPVAIAGFNTFRGVELGTMSAAILISVVPVLIASFFVQRRLIQGLSGGGVKG